jgi:hypothetical protein
MLLFLLVLGLVCAVFFYCQAIKSGLGYKRWTLAGIVFGPLIWPMFCMQKRMKINKRFGFNYLIFKA